MNHSTTKSHRIPALALLPLSIVACEEALESESNANPGTSRNTAAERSIDSLVDALEDLAPEFCRGYLACVQGSYSPAELDDCLDAYTGDVYEYARDFVIEYGNDCTEAYIDYLNCAEEDAYCYQRSTPGTGYDFGARLSCATEYVAMLERCDM